MTRLNLKESDMNTITLRRYMGRKPLTALVDDEDYAAITQHTWQRNFHGYVVGNIDGTDVYLHRFIMGYPEGRVVDHINGDKLDNRRSNLRVCKHKENTRNARRSKNNTSGHTGVSYRPKRKSYRAYITVDRRQIGLGHYPTLEEAVAARKKGERKYFGEFAYSGSQ